MSFTWTAWQKEKAKLLAEVREIVRDEIKLHEAGEERNPVLDELDAEGYVPNRDNAVSEAELEEKRG